MKKFLFAALLVMIPCMLKAQTKSGIRYRGSVGLSAGVTAVIPVGVTIEDTKYASITSYVETVHGIEFNNAATVGVGIAGGPHLHSKLDDYNQIVPGLDFFLHFDYAFLQGKKVRPVLGTRAGYALSETIAGPHIDAGFGMRIKDQWDLGIWYRPTIGVLPSDRVDIGHSLYLAFAWRFPGYKKARNK